MGQLKHAFKICFNVSLNSRHLGRKMLNINQIEELLSDQSDLLSHECKTVDKSELHLPSPTFINDVVTNSDRSNKVLGSYSRLMNHGRLANTGYVSILPVDQGIEHSGIKSFAPNTNYFDPENIVKLAIEGGCNAVASTMGVLRSVSRKYAHQIPFIAKINHNEMLTTPATYDQTLFGDNELIVKQAYDLGAVGIGATIYFGSPESTRQIQEVSHAFEVAHSLGMVTILWCYLRNPNFKTDNCDYHEVADLTSQANHLGVTIGADIIKQKLPTFNYDGFDDVATGQSSPAAYDGRLSSDNPIDMTRLQLVHCYNGRSGLINSGGPSGDDDLAQAVTTAVINKRAGGTGLISGRKAFQKPLAEGVQLLNAIQDVYLNDEVTIA